MVGFHVGFPCNTNKKQGYLKNIHTHKHTPEWRQETASFLAHKLLTTKCGLMTTNYFFLFPTHPLLRVEQCYSHEYG